VQQHWNANPLHPLVKVGTSRSPAIAEKAVCTASSGRAMQQADNGYSGRENSGGSLVHNMF